MSEPLAPLLVSSESIASDDPYDVILTNIEVVNALAELLAPDELVQDALVSYYTDFYQAQVANGGFAQFVFNSGWSPLLVDAVAAGLEAMEAPRHAAVFAQARAAVDALSEYELQEFFESELFGENETRDRLDAAAEGFDDAEDDLVLRNSAFLRSRPDLVVLPEAELGEAIEQVFAALPDRAEREEALDNMPQPDYVQLIEALCEASGQDLDRITAGSPSGDGSVIWYFLTDKGLHFYKVIGDEAVMFDGETEEERARVNVAEVVTPVG